MKLSAPALCSQIRVEGLSAFASDIIRVHNFCALSEKGRTPVKFSVLDEDVLQVATFQHGRPLLGCDKEIIINYCDILII
jgi:hypothetical protein